MKPSRNWVERVDNMSKVVNKAGVIEQLTSSELLTDIQSLMEGLADKDDLRTRLLNLAGSEIDSFVDSIEHVNDTVDVQYLLAVRYAYIKAQWIGLNTQMNYSAVAGKDVPDDLLYQASLLSLLLLHMEKVAHPEAIQHITRALSEPLREAA